MTKWRGFYCEHYAGKVLLWGPGADGQVRFLGSARTMTELWGTLERSTESEEAVRFEGEQVRRRSMAYHNRAPDLPADRQERDRAIEEHIQSQGVTRPKPKAKRQDTQTKAPGLTLEDLDL